MLTYPILFGIICIAKEGVVMLLQFLTQNYASIRDEIILSLQPSAVKEHPENIIHTGKYKALGMAAIYGANASGKTAVYRGITLALLLLRSSNTRQINDKLPVVQFKFDKASVVMPTKFEFTFIAGDGKKYIYGYSFDTNKIHEEYLYRYNSTQPGLIFERNGSEYKFARAEKNLLEPLVRMNTENKLFLATATAWNVESTKIPFKWLAEGIDSYTNDENIQNISLDQYRTLQEENVDFAKQLLKQADINISNIQVEAEKINLPTGFPLIGGVVVAGQLIQPQEQYKIKITTDHIIKDDKGKTDTYTLSLGEESLGTQQLFFLAPLLRQTFKEGKVLVIDEIDRSLHPYIVKFLVNMFRNPSVNKSGAQLIFTTHETTLLSLDIFRRDQIYFTEKNAESGVTDLYSLDEFSVRKTDNIEKGYLLGRYGAIPFLKTEDII